MSSSPNIYQVQVVEPLSGLLRTICLYPGIESDEISEIFSVTFDLKHQKTEVVGFCDANEVYYPFSLLAHNPSGFDGNKLRLVYKSDSIRAFPSVNKHLLPANSEENFATNLESTQDAFLLLDINEDKLVHKEEFIEFLTEAFQALFDTSTRYSFTYASIISAKDLAIATSIQCYNVIGTHENYFLNFADFRNWYQSSTTDPFREVTINAIEAYKHNSHSLSNAGEKVLRRSKSRVSLSLSNCYDDEKIQTLVKSCRYYLKLSLENVSTVLDRLQQLIFKKQMISRQQYCKIFYDIYLTSIDNNNSILDDSSDNEYFVQLLDLLYTILGPDKETDEVSIMHLASLVALCSDLDSSLLVFKGVFDLYQDTVDVGYVDDDILYIFLCQIVRIIYHLNPAFHQITNSSPHDLAHAVALKFLMMSDVNRKIRFKFSFEEFLEVFVHSLKLTLDALQIPAGFFIEYLVQFIGYQSSESTKLNASDMSTGVDFEDSCETNDSLDESQVKAFFVKYDGDVVPLMEAKSIFGLLQYSPQDIIAALKAQADAKGSISFLEYQNVITQFIGKTYIALTVIQRSVADFIMDRIFSVFDIYDTGKCNIRLLGCALLLFCRDSYRNRAKIAFDILRSVGTPRSFAATHRLNPLVVTQCLADLFKARACLDPNVKDFLKLDEKSKSDASEHVSRMNQERHMIDEHDENGLVDENDFLDLFCSVLYALEHTEYIPEKTIVDAASSLMKSSSFDEMLQNFSGEGLEKNDKLTVNAFSGDENDDDEENIFLSDELFPPSVVVLELRAASSILGLETYKADDMMETLGQRCEINRLSLDNWLDWVRYVTTFSNISSQDIKIAMNLGERIFNAFDVNDEGEINFDFVAIGLSFLCCGSPLEDKIMVAFTMADGNADGYITAEEFQNMISSVLLIITVCSRLAADKIVHSGVQIEDLSRVAMEEGMSALNVTLSEEVDLSLDMVIEISDDYLKLAAMY